MDSKAAPGIAFIGSGVMAEVMINGLLTRRLTSPERIWASGPRASRAEELQTLYGINGVTDNREALVAADMVVLAVKPQTLAGVLKELRGVIRPEQLLVSIVAGARMGPIGEALQHPAIVRCMPNLPCRIHRGMTVWTATREVTVAQRSIVREMLETMGQEVFSRDELDLDRATAVSGSGPAIIALFVKALEDAANFIGESRPLARQTVLQTIIGTAELIRASDQHIGALIDGVTSPGGTTSRALHVLHHGRMSAIVTDSIEAAFNRSVEMGKNLDEQVRRLSEELAAQQSD